MGVKYVVDLMPVRYQRSLRVHYPASVFTEADIGPPSQFFFFYRKKILLTSVQGVDDLLETGDLLTAEEKRLIEVVSRLMFLDDTEGIRLVRDILIQRQLERVSDHLEEGYQFPFGKDSVARVLKENISDLEQRLFVTEEIETGRWLRWSFLGDSNDLDEIKARLLSVSRCSLEFMLEQISKKTGWTMRRFPVPKGVSMTKWAGIWAQLFEQGLVVPLSSEGIWSAFDFHFQATRGSTFTNRRSGSLRVLASRFLDQTVLLGKNFDDRKYEIENLRSSAREARLAGSANHNQKVAVSVPHVPLLEDLFMRIHQLELANKLPKGYQLSGVNSIFGSLEDIHAYLKWKSTVL